MSGKGGIEKIIQRMNDTLAAKIYTLSLSDGVYDESGFFYQKNISNINWIPKGKGKHIRLKFSNRTFNTISHLIISFLYLAFNKVDCVVATGPMQVNYLSKIIKLLNKNIPLYGWPHFSKDSGFGDFENFKLADRVLCISRGIMEEMRGLGIEDKKIIYFPNPFSATKKNTPCTGNVFHYVGRIQFSGQKNIKELLDALTMVNSNIVVNFIGDGPDLDYIKRYAIEKNIIEKVSFEKGWFDNPWELINESKGLILTSRFEGLPTVIGEAMSLGIPVISSDCRTGPADFIKNGCNGYLYQEGNIKELARVIDDMYLNGVSLETDGIKKSISYFYMDEYVKRFNDVFE